MESFVIDFTNKNRRKKTYAGANGNKISVIHQDKLYMLKFPTTPTVDTRLSYVHNCFSEYIGCHIFNMLGIKAQKTSLGVFMNNNKLKIIVACEDFTDENFILQDFASLKNQIINSNHSGYGTSLEEILEHIIPTVKVDKIIKPRYNFKASEEVKPWQVKKES